MLPSLFQWVVDAVEALQNDMHGQHPDIFGVLERRLRINVDRSKGFKGSIFDLLAPMERSTVYALDLLDCLLGLLPWTTQGRDLPARLEQAFAEASFSFRVSQYGDKLERRIDKTVTRGAETVINAPARPPRHAGRVRSGKRHTRRGPVRAAPRPHARSVVSRAERLARRRGPRGAEMSSLVEELQRDALSPQVSLVDLLRKALVVAKKLDVADFERWLTRELSGYPSTDDYTAYPEYRILHGEVRAAVPGRYIPVIFTGPDAARLNRVYSRMPTARPIAELESLVQAHPEGLIISYTPEVQVQLMKGAGCPEPPALHVPTHQLIGVLNSVKNIVLEWALRLEKDGIVGQGMSFSTEEKQTASSIHYSVTNFYGAITGSAIQAGSPGAPQNF